MVAHSGDFRYTVYNNSIRNPHVRRPSKSRQRNAASRTGAASDFDVAQLPHNVSQAIWRGTELGAASGAVVTRDLKLSTLSCREAAGRAIP